MEKLRTASRFSPIRTADGLTFAVVAEFTYNSSSFVIWFLNEELTAAITTAFNGQRARREAGARLPFAHLHLDNITDLVKCECPSNKDGGTTVAIPCHPVHPVWRWFGADCHQGVLGMHLVVLLPQSPMHGPIPLQYQSLSCGTTSPARCMAMRVTSSTTWGMSD